MARTAITPAAGTRNAGVAPNSANVDVTNGMTIASAGVKLEKLNIRVANTATAAKSIIIRAGSSLYPAVLSGQGDLTVALPASSTVVIPVLDSARFEQPDGSLSIDFASGTTGTIETYYRP